MGSSCCKIDDSISDDRQPLDEGSANTNRQSRGTNSSSRRTAGSRPVPQVSLCS